MPGLATHLRQFCKPPAPCRASHPNPLCPKRGIPLKTPVPHMRHPTQTPCAPHEASCPNPGPMRGISPKPGCWGKDGTLRQRSTKQAPSNPRFNMGFFPRLNNYKITNTTFEIQALAALPSLLRAPQPPGQRQAGSPHRDMGRASAPPENCFSAQGLVKAKTKK